MREQHKAEAGLILTTRFFVKNKEKGKKKKRKKKRVFTYTGFEEVPRVVDSADGARPPTACTVQSHTRVFFFIAKIFQKYRKKKTHLLTGRWLARMCVCLRVSDSTSSNPRTARRRTGRRRRFEPCWAAEEPRAASSGCSLRTFYERTGCLPA